MNFVITIVIVLIFVYTVYFSVDAIVAAVLTINQTYNNLGLFDLVADSQILLLNNQSIVQLEVHLLGMKVSHHILISSTQTLAAKTDFLCGRPQARPRGERG